MKKRILSILLMCCMVLTLLPVQALAEDSAYTVGEDTGVSVRALAGTAGTKLKADNIDTYLANGLGDGVYTLAEDVTISGTLRVTGDATVDLNGHVLRFDQSAQPDSIFRVEAGKTLTHCATAALRRSMGMRPCPRAASSPAAGATGMTAALAAIISIITMAAACMWRRARPSCWRAAPSMPAASRAERM